MIKREDLYWLAGIIEGEGCFSLNGKSPVILVEMTDLDIIERVRALMAPHVILYTITHPGSKNSFKFQLCGTKANGWMMMLYPILGIRRRAKIREILTVWKNTRPNDGRADYCKNGHPYKNNTYITGEGNRSCRICRAASSKAYQLRKKAS